MIFIRRQNPCQHQREEVTHNAKKTRGTSETKGETVTETDTDTTGDSRTITVTSENKSVKYILEKIDQHLARIKNCEAFGLWDIACYFVSENVQTSVVAASTYKALMAGFDSGVENSYVNVWKQDNTENTPALLEYLRYCIHPRFSIPGDDQFFEVESQTVNPCSLISGNEMPYIMGLPHHSVPGVTVLNMAEFGRNVRFSTTTVNTWATHYPRIKSCVVCVAQKTPLALQTV